MAWKDLSAWIRGGIYGLIVGIIAVIMKGIALATAESFKGIYESLSWILVLPSLIIQMPASLIFRISWQTGGSMIVTLIGYLLLGIIIGAIIGKIKSK